MIVVMKIQKFEFEQAGEYRIPFPVTFDLGKMLGYLPVYETREDAEKDYPDGPFATVEFVK
jgi:hypothetical protein